MYTYVRTYRILQQAYARSLFYLTAVSCHFIAAAYHVAVTFISVAHSANCRCTWQSSGQKWLTVLVRHNKDPVLLVMLPS